MPRNISTQMLSEIAKNKVSPVHLFEAHFDDEVVRNTDAYRDIVWNGNTYIANGHFISFSGLDESGNMAITTATISLSGVDQIWISLVLSKNYVNRPLKIYLGFVSDSFAPVASDYSDTGYVAIDYWDLGIVIGIENEISTNLVPDPFLVFDGFMDDPVITDDPSVGAGQTTSTVSISAVSQWIDFERISGRHTNHEDQQIHFPGDKGFEFVSEINKSLTWGRE